MRRASGRVWCIGLAAVVGGLVGSAERPARAYATPTAFDADPVSGGGGGRFFTGAPEDRFTCEVCHSGAEAPQLAIDGLPEGLVRWGDTYDISIAIADVGGGAVIVAEMVEPTGRAVGTMEAIAIDEAAPEELCASGLPATAIYEPPLRSVAAMSKCGATRMRVRWTAPDVPIPGTRLHLSAVVSDDSGDPWGDGVFASEYVLEPSGDADAVVAGCSLDAERGELAPAWLLVPAWGIRRRRRRR